MNVDKDYYATLGVLPSIDAIALGAVYRALLKKYHPDVFSGPKTDADRITKELNEAYQVLGDARTRAEYDRQRARRQQTSGDYEGESGRSEGQNESSDEALRSNWQYMVRYYPEVEQYRKELATLSASLALSFQVTLLETKAAATAAQLSSELRKHFLERYFGTNTTVHDFVVDALKEKRRDVALEVNRAIKVVGSPTPQATSQFLSTVRRLTGWEHNQRQTQRNTQNESSPKPEAPPPAKGTWSEWDWATIGFALAILMLLIAFLRAQFVK